MKGRLVAPNGLSVILSVDQRRRDPRLGRRVDRYGRRGGERQDGRDQRNPNFAQYHVFLPSIAVAHAEAARVPERPLCHLVSRSRSP
jgi:hypothetical protein